MEPSVLASDSLAQKLTLYGIGVGALSAVATTTAHAAIIITGSGQTGNTFYFNLQNTTPISTTNGTGEQFELYTSTNKAKGGEENATTNEFATESKTGQSGSATNYFLKLASGATIGGTRTFSTTGYFNDYYVNGTDGGEGGSGTKSGDWKPGNRGFLGLEFTDSNNQVDYGFADVTLNNLNGTNTYTLNGFAYDNTGAAITTFSIVPEPGSTTALLVAGGAAGVAALRRRRKGQTPAA